MGSTFTLATLIVLVWLFVVKETDFSVDKKKSSTKATTEKIKEVEENLPNYVTGNSSTTGGLPYGAALQDPKKDSNTSSEPAYRENRGANRN